MIKKSNELSLAETKDLVKKLPESEKTKEVSSYIKRFVKLELKEAQKLKKELQELLPSLSLQQIIKIIDLLPQDSEDARKIFVGAGIDENEITKILEIVKKYL